MANLANKLALIQTSLGALDHTVEGILGTLKPQLLEQSISLTIADDSVDLAGKIASCKATATVYDGEADERISSSGIAFAAVDNVDTLIEKAEYKALKGLLLLTNMEVIENNFGGKFEPKELKESDEHKVDEPKELKELKEPDELKGEPKEEPKELQHESPVRKYRGKTQLRTKQGWMPLEALERDQLEWIIGNQAFACIHEEAKELLNR